MRKQAEGPGPQSIVQHEFCSKVCIRHFAPGQSAGVRIPKGPRDCQTGLHNKERFCNDLAKGIILQSMEPASGQSEPASGGELTLRRSIGLWQMTLYAAGSMLGAGIYGLVGRVAAEMGSAIWLAFLLSLVAAGLTGLSYASLGSRYPRIWSVSRDTRCMDRKASEPCTFAAICTTE